MMNTTNPAPTPDDAIKAKPQPQPAAKVQSKLQTMSMKSAKGLPSIDDIDEVRATNSGVVVWLLALFLLIFFVWAWVFEIVEVSHGVGKVIPSSREQRIQSREGGILATMRVHEGDVVEKGQVLAQLDPTLGESSVEETGARYRAALAASARLQAEVDGKSDWTFPAELKDYPQLRNQELALFRSRRDSLQETLRGLNHAAELVNSELEITRKLVAAGAASNVDLIRLQRQKADLQLKITETRSGYMVNARQELAKSEAEVNSLQQVMRGRADSLERLTIESPVRGIVKTVDVTTIGGVVPPNGSLMTIVPLDDQLLVEARISPKDIAFIHPDQEALVKFTAYDYAIYGGLKGRVVTIAPDTMRDEIHPDQVYYPVYVRTDADALVNKQGKRFAIVPGMVATTDIRTGSKTVWDYLTKPFNRAREALRER